MSVFVIFRFLGAFLQNSKETTVFLLDDDDGICGYCVGVFDAKDFIVKSNAWLVEVSSSTIDVVFIVLQNQKIANTRCDCRFKRRMMIYD